MTKIKWSGTVDTFNISVLGHAGYDENGKDIVCAGISTISSMFLNELKRMKTQGRILKLITETKDGYFSADCEFDIKKVYECRKAIDVLLRGYEGLAKTYPDYIEIERR